MSKAIVIVAIAILLGIGLVIFINQNPPTPESENLVRSDTQVTPFKAPQQPAQNQQTQQPSPTLGPTPDTSVLSATDSSKVVIRTNKGNITASLYNKDAKRAVENFYVKSASGFYNNLIFHRVEDWVIQGGDPLGNGTGGGTMPSEYNNKPFVVGSLGMARGNDPAVSNDAQFFITKTDASWLNSQYINFGIVTDGIDVVNKIAIGDRILSIEFPKDQ
jgi:peptidyl-prolyl cis-trans isomerase B (cyclophilin B)